MADKQSREECVGGTTIQEQYAEILKRKKAVKIDVDVSEALTGLKAIQREARDAAKALRELEEAQMIEELVDKSITDDIRRSYE